MSDAPEARFPWPAGKTAAAAISVDVDAESAMLFEHPASVDYLNLLSHQWYGPRVGVGRILRLLARYDLRGTFFLPGFTIEQWPEVVRAISADGHELGLHGYLHEPLYDVDERTQEEYVARGLAAFAGAGLHLPRGFRAPKFRLGFRTPAVLAKYNFRYDSSLMDADYPYALGVEPRPGSPAIIELPVSWALDDWAYYAFVPGFTPVTTIQRPQAVLAAWREEFDAIADVAGVFVLTIHPFLSGRPARIRAVEGLIEYIAARSDVWFTTLAEIASYAASLQLETVVNVPPSHPYTDDLHAAPPAAPLNRRP